MFDTVLIIGTNKLTRGLIPWDRDDADYWVLNEVASLRDETPEYRAMFLGSESTDVANEYWCKRVDGVFQIHTPAIWRNLKNRNHDGHYAWLKKSHTFPIWMQDIYPDVPASVRYPFAEICADLLANIWREDGNNPGKIQMDYFTSSVAYAIALAIYQRRKRIYIHGIETSSDTEYIRQRAGVAFWLGIAAGRGVDVVLQKRSLLLNELLYGYTAEIAIGKAEFEIAAQALEPELKQAEIAMIKGKNQVSAVLAKLASTRSKSIAEIARTEFFEKLDQQSDRIFDYSFLAGRRAENVKYVGECDALAQAQGNPQAAIQRQELDLTAHKLAEDVKHNEVAVFEANGRVKALLDALGQVKVQTDANRLNKTFIAALNAQQKTVWDYGFYSGMHVVNAQGAERCDELIEAAGGEKALEALVNT